MVKQELTIRTLTLADLAAADEIRKHEGWNQTLTDWKRLIEHQPDGCFAAIQQEQLVGTVSTTVHDGQLAWIGMMLVDHRQRRQGIGTTLMQTALDYLHGQSVPCVKLDATPQGRPVYLKLGFREESQIQRWAREATSPSAAANALDTTLWLCGDEAVAAWSEVQACDVTAFGVDRSKWCLALARDSRVVLERSPDGLAVGMVRDGSRAHYIGPIIGNSPHAARRVIQHLSILSGPAFWDIPTDNKVARQEAESLGFTPVRDLYRMWLGQPVAERIDYQYALTGPETG